jgi:hypothetical protein
MSTSPSAGAHFPGAEAKFVTCNTLPDAQVARLAELFRADRPRRLVLVSGLSDDDEQYLLDAAAHHATRAGAPTRVGRMALGAFEPDRQTPAQYLSELLERLASAETERDQRLRKEAAALAKQLQVDLSFSLAAALSLVVSLGPAAMALLAGRGEDADLSGAPPGRTEHLHRLLRTLTARRQLVLFLPGLETLPDTFVGELTHLYKHNPRLVLAFGCADAETAKVGPWEEPVSARVALAPHDRRSLERVLAQRFPEHRLPRGLADLLLRASDGSPWLLAGLLQRVAEADVLAPAPRPWWSLAGGRMDARAEAALDALLPLVSRDRERIDALRVSRDRRDHALRELVLRAALCGPAIPLRLVADTVAAVRAGACAADEVIQALDASLGDGTPEPRDALLRRRHARQAAFPADVTVYEFRDDLTRWAVASLPSEHERRGWARELLAAAEAHLPVHTRGIAQMLLELARVSEDGEALAHWEWRLSWWVSAQEADALRSAVEEGLREGRLDPGPLFQVALSEQDALQPRIRLALLDALETQGIPWPLVPHFYSWRGGMHQELDQIVESAHDLQRALATCPDGEDSLRWNIVAGLGAALGHLQNRAEAERYGLEALELAEGLARDDADHRLLVSHGNLSHIFHGAEDRERAALHARAAWKHAQALAAAGELEEHDRRYVLTLISFSRYMDDAAERLSLVKRMTNYVRDHLGADDSLSLLAASGLAEVLDQQGLMDEQFPLEEELLKRCGRVLGEDHHLTTVAMSNLASLLELRGDLPRARTYLERTVELRAQREGKEHPETLGAMTRYAKVLCKLGEVESARSLAEHALLSFRQVRGEHSRYTLAAEATLALILYVLDEDAAAQKLRERVQSVLRARPERDYKSALAALRDLADAMYHRGKTSAAIELDEQLVTEYQRRLGGDHPAVARVRGRLQQWREAAAVAGEGGGDSAQPAVLS